MTDNYRWENTTRCMGVTKKGVPCLRVTFQHPRDRHDSAFCYSHKNRPMNALNDDYDFIPGSFPVSIKGEIK